METASYGTTFPPEPRPRRRRGLRLVLRLLAGGAFAFVLLAFLGTFAQLFSPGGREIQEVLLDGKGPDKLVLIDLQGPLIRGGDAGLFGSSADPVAWVLEALDRARSDAHVKGVLLRIDSPGGGMTESDEIHREVTLLRKEGKTVVAFLGDVAASGGYYVAAGADEIVAAPTGLTGSIGVILSAPDVSELAAKVGVQMNVIKSGAMKDVGSMFRPMSDEERETLQGMVDQMYERFLEKVWESRRHVKFPEDGPANTKDYWRSLADGRIFTALDAYQHGLVDDLMYRDEAVERLKERSGQKDAALVEYHPPRRTLADLLLGVFHREAPASTGWSPRRVIGALTPRVMALWTGR